MQDTLYKPELVGVKSLLLLQLIAPFAVAELHEMSCQLVVKGDAALVATLPYTYALLLCVSVPVTATPLLVTSTMFEPATWRLCPWSLLTASFVDPLDAV